MNIKPEITIDYYTLENFNDINLQASLLSFNGSSLSSVYTSGA